MHPWTQGQTVLSVVGEAASKTIIMGESWSVTEVVVLVVPQAERSMELVVIKNNCIIHRDRRVARLCLPNYWGREWGGRRGMG